MDYSHVSIIAFFCHFRRNASLTWIKWSAFAAAELVSNPAPANPVRTPSRSIRQVHPDL
jgi:hypothetical protein